MIIFNFKYRCYKIYVPYFPYSYSFFQHLSTRNRALVWNILAWTLYFLTFEALKPFEPFETFFHLLVENRIYAVSGLVRISDVVRPNRLFGTVCTHMCRLHMAECWLTAIQFRFLAAFAVFWFSNSFCHSPWVTNEQLHCSQE